MTKRHVFLKTFFAMFIMLLLGQKIVTASNIFVYDEGDLGITYTEESTTFKVWSTSAKSIKVVIKDETPVEMTKEDSTSNVWVCTIEGNLKEKEYSYTVEYEDGEIYYNVLDPYGQYLNTTKDRNIIYTGLEANYTQWEEQNNNLDIADDNKIIYALNVKKYTSDSTWNGTELYRGKLLGLIEPSTRYEGYTTGYDYLKTLGITYIELDDIVDLDNPFMPNKELVIGTEYYANKKEFRNFVNAYYNNDIGIIAKFDYKSLSDNFLNNIGKIDRNYYLKNENELDLGKQMVQQYIKELVNYWIQEYKISGIKFENISSYSIDFINSIKETISTEHPDFLVYGDDLNAENKENKTNQYNLNKINDVAMVSNAMNYALFGNLNSKIDYGILQGNSNSEYIETLKFALFSTIDNGQIKYNLVKGIANKNYWGNTSTYQIINKLGEYSGLTLYDKFKINSDYNDALIKQKMILAWETMMLAGGIPYVQSGDEFLISYFDETNNTAGNSICIEDDKCYYSRENQNINWSYIAKNKDANDSFKALINFRKNNATRLLNNYAVVKNNISVYQFENNPLVVGYTRIYSGATNGYPQSLFVVINYSNSEVILDSVNSEDWEGVYTYNGASRIDDDIKLTSNSIYMEQKIKKSKVHPLITLLFVLVVIGGVYTANIYLSKKLVQEGYDPKNIKKKYRPFVKKYVNKEETEQSNEIAKDIEQKDEEKME